MPSPFPGMDPYLEGYLWPDVHQRLAAEISRRLAPRIKPRYVTRLAISVIEDMQVELEIGIMYPDVEILTSRFKEAPIVTYTAKPLASAAPAISPSFALPLLEPVQVRLVTVEVRDAAQNELVTGIEILSPVNKRSEGLEKYRQKRKRLHRAGVHLLEIDLVRCGTRPVIHPHLPDAPYLVSLTRADGSALEVWPVRLQDTLPVVAVPLRRPDPDVPLELGPILAAIYEEAAYDLSIDYSQPPPPPPLGEEEDQWLRSLLTP